jgi:hypothetical protein
MECIFFIIEIAVFAGNIGFASTKKLKGATEKAAKTKYR